MGNNCSKCGSINIYQEEDGKWCYKCQEFTFTEDECNIKNTWEKRNT